MASHEREPLLGEKFVSLESTAKLEQKPHDVFPVERRKIWWEERCKGERRTWRSRWPLLIIICGTVLTLYTVFSASTVRDRSSITSPSDSQMSPIEVTGNGSIFSCAAGKTCYPTFTEWSAFNHSIGGSLQVTLPWAEPCYYMTNSQDCQNIKADYNDSQARTEQYGSTEFLDWESCGDSNCFLDPLSPSRSPVSAQCSLGRLSPYYVDARTPEDISKTLKFVRQHGLRLSIKNTGHDYFGRSTAANSLAIWTHNMKDIAYHEEFQPQGCKTKYKDVGQIGAGVQAQDAWEYFEQLNMLVTVGAVGSVGLAGGFGQGGGHGPLGPSFGLMVDQAIEFEVVTADGKKRTINECTEPDLFWAMRGGGGGTFAVLTSYKFQLHFAVPINVYSFQASISHPLNLSTSEAHRDIVRALARNQSLFSQHRIAGYNFLLPDEIVSLQVLPSADTSAIEAVTAQWRDFLTSYPGLNVTENRYYSFSKFSEWHAFTEEPSIAHNGLVGIGLAESGRFLPKSLFSTDEDIESVVDAVVNAMQYSNANGGRGIAQLYATGPVNQPDNSKTGVNPAWRTAMWEVIMGGIWTSTVGPRMKVQNTISKAIQPFKDLTPGGGCYMNEGDYTEENWQQTFFGDNYAKLLKVKRKWDPGMMFNCWKCVGWTGYQDPMYSCYSQTGQKASPSVPLSSVT